MDDLRQRLRLKEADSLKAIADARQATAKAVSLEGRLKALNLDLEAEKRNALESLAETEQTFRREKVVWEQELDSMRARLHGATAELQQLKSMKLEADRRQMEHLARLQEHVTDEAIGPNPKP
mmetsp:Transcript_31811/g.101222  ORF Transcript_31811/g.101222 Transcript_31811/m.101222 type:complete len:123 (-) Transcript_31811:202-570(-)